MIHTVWVKKIDMVKSKPVWINGTGSAWWIRWREVNAITSQIIAVISGTKIFFSDLNWFWSRSWRKGSHQGQFRVIRVNEVNRGQLWSSCLLTFAASADAIDKVWLLSIFIKLFNINNSGAFVAGTFKNSTRIRIRPTAPVSWTSITQNIVIKAGLKESYKNW